MTVTFISSFCAKGTIVCHPTSQKQLQGKSLFPAQSEQKKRESLILWMGKPHPISSLRRSNIFSLVRQGAARPGLSRVWVGAGLEVPGRAGEARGRGISPIRNYR